jgi:YegS/Rv2252/BmrU family lipid kinase
VTREDPFLVVVNPSAGAGRGRERLATAEAVFRREGADYTVSSTRGPRDATRIVREALADGTKGVAVLGGDGTLHEAVNGFFDERGQSVANGAWLGVLPGGTGGDFRKAVGLTRDIEASVHHLLKAEPRPIDVGEIHYRDHDGADARSMFINIASFGISGLVVQLVNDAPKALGGTASFLIGTLRAMMQYRNRRVRITVDGGPPRETSIVTMAVANGQYFGGGMRIAPRAELSDGWLDVVGLEDMSVIQQLRLTPHMYRGTVLGQPGVIRHRGREIVAEPADDAGPILLDVDGEAPGSLPATFRVREACLMLKG